MKERFLGLFSHTVCNYNIVIDEVAERFSSKFFETLLRNKSSFFDLAGLSEAQGKTQHRQEAVRIFFADFLEFLEGLGFIAHLAF